MEEDAGSRRAGPKETQGHPAREVGGILGGSPGSRRPAGPLALLPVTPSPGWVSGMRPALHSQGNDTSGADKQVEALTVAQAAC